MERFGPNLPTNHCFMQKRNDGPSFSYTIMHPSKAIVDPGVHIQTIRTPCTFVAFFGTKTRELVDFGVGELFAAWIEPYSFCRSDFPVTDWMEGTVSKGIDPDHFPDFGWQA
ncbi:unnamed protein product [Periconia digitata]|uniref:Uncharacterized protein n=1 Tax=Periconia digitata TaxID=1303443 RepID=A0A9W4UCX1_9PLEO|nr:unnamed protein product [Periconia digitata]